MTLRWTPKSAGSAWALAFLAVLGCSVAAAIIESPFTLLIVLAVGALSSAGFAAIPCAAMRRSDARWKARPKWMCWLSCALRLFVIVVIVAVAFMVPALGVGGMGA